MVVAENYFVEEPQALLLRNKNFAYECVSVHIIIVKKIVIIINTSHT